MYAIYSRARPDKIAGDPRAKTLAGEIRQLHADADYVKVEDEVIRVNRKLDELKLQLLNRGRERSRSEYNDLNRRERRISRRRHPIRWVTRGVRGWARRHKIRRGERPNAMSSGQRYVWTGIAR